MPDNDDELLKRQREQQEQQQQQQQRTALPEQPERGDTSALSPLTQPQEGIDMSKRPKTKAPSGARRAGMQMAAEARQFGDEFSKSLQEDKENIRGLFSNPERQAERQARREERKAAKQQTETVPDTTAVTPQGQTEQPVEGQTEQTAQPVENTGNAQGGGGTVPVADGGTLNAATVTAERGNAAQGQTAQGGAQYTKEGPLQDEEAPGNNAPKGTYERTFGEPNPATTTTSAEDDTPPTDVSPTPTVEEETTEETGEEAEEDETPVENTEENGEGTPEGNDEEEDEKPEEGTETAPGVTQTGAGATTVGTEAGAGVQNPTGETADPRVKALDEYSTAVQGINNDFEKWSADMIKRKEEYDEEQQRRDRQNAFWHGIGEVGAALVNLLGVSGAFGGKNAYGRGAYSAMQNFNLTTEKMTDSMRAAAEKRREALDSLNERLENIRLQRRQGAADIILKKGEAEGKARDTAYQRARDEEHWKKEIDLRQQQIDNAKEQADRQYQLSLRAYGDNRKALDDAAKTKGGSGGSGGSGGGKGATPVHLRYPAQIMKYERDENGEIVKDEKGNPKGEMVWGWKYISAPEETFYKTLHPMRGQLADELARMLGFTSFNDFNGSFTWNGKAKEYRSSFEPEKDNSLQQEVMSALKEYRKAMESTRGKELSKATDDKLNDWADRYWALSDKFGALLDTALASYNPYGVGIQSHEDAPQGYGGNGQNNTRKVGEHGNFQ